MIPAFTFATCLIIGGCNESKPESLPVSTPELVVSDDPCRSKLPVSKKTDILLLSGYEGTAISTVTVTDHTRDTEVTRVIIENGKKPLFIIAATYEDMIWSIEGHTERVSGFVARKSRKSMGPGAGVIGLAASKVDFMPYDCMKYFHKKRDPKARAAKARLKLAYGQSIDQVVTDYTLDSIGLPSGTMSGEERREARRTKEKKSKAKRTKITKGLSFSALEKYKPAHQTELYRYYDDGIAYIDTKHVVSPGPLSDYDVYPDHAGLAQLIETGHIKKTDKRTYYIRKTFPHFPAGLGGAHSVKFILGKGVKRPDGKPGHSSLVDEATGNCISKRCK